MIQFVYGSEFLKDILPLIKNAKKSIDILVFDWRWYPHDPANPVQIFNQSLVRSSRSGIIVRAVSNTRDVIDILNNEGIKSKHYRGSKLLHSKLMIIDEKIVVIGSHNYTASAMQSNHEVSAILVLPEKDDRLLRYFNLIYNMA